MIENPELIEKFILDIERCISHSKFDHAGGIFDHAVAISTAIGNTDYMLVEAILRVAFAVYKDIVENTYPTADELEELRSFISEELKTMAKAVSAQDEENVQRSLLNLPILLGPLKQKLIYEDRLAPKKISVDFDVEKTKSKIYDEFMGSKEDIFKKIMAEMLEQKTKR